MALKRNNHGFVLAIMADNFLEWYSGIPDAYILVLICKVVSRAKIVCVHIVALNFPIIPSSSKRMLKVFMIFLDLKEEYLPLCATTWGQIFIVAFVLSDL